MTEGLHAFAQRRGRVADLLDRLAALVDAHGAHTTDATLSLRAGAERAREGRFVVLLLGGFSSGKSTLLNALLGAHVLPVKVNPCTAILTEVVHGHSPGVEVRYRDAAPRRMDVAQFLAEFQLRTELDEAGAEASDRFGDVDRAVVAWPLRLLEDGVVILDTPGLDDDPARTERTLHSLPEADAVILVLNATRFLSDLERRIVRRELLPRGLTNLFFPVAMIDLVESLSDDPSRDRAEITSRGRRILGPLCEVDGEDRFNERFFPIDSRSALRARWDRDARAPRATPNPDLLARSGFPPFEAALEAFLVRERGRAQLELLLRVASRVRDDLHRQSELDRATGVATLADLEARRAGLEPQLARLEAVADRVGDTVDRFVQRQGELVWHDLRDFFARAEDELPEAVAGFDLGPAAGLGAVAPGGRERLEARLREELEAWLAERVATWQRSLKPRLDRALRDLRKELAGDAADFDALTEHILLDFTAGALGVPGDEGPDDSPGPLERWFSVAVGAVLLSPGTMAAGWAQGYEGALNGAASRLGARLAVLALGALLGPVGWVGLVLYAVSDAVLLVLTGGGQLRRVREQVAAGLRGRLVAQADASRDDVIDRVREGFHPLRDGLVDAARAEARALGEQLDAVLADRRAAADTATSRAAAWHGLLAEVDAGIRAIAAEVGGGDGP